MTATLLDFSRTDDLRLHGEVTGAVQRVAQARGMDVLIAGAFARDLHLHYRFGIDTRRRTEDIDLALAVPDWDAFAALRQRLLDGGAFREEGAAQHRLRHDCGLPIDLVPFGAVESPARSIAWPPSGDTVMDVFGFREAMAHGVMVALPGVERCAVVSLPALALLKLICWEERHYRAPQKDAHDLRLILAHYLAAGNEQRLWDEFQSWTQEDGFTYEAVGPRMLGQDIRKMLRSEDVGRVQGLLEQQASADEPGRLPSEMLPRDPDAARTLLRAVLQGLRAH